MLTGILTSTERMQCNMPVVTVVKNKSSKSDYIVTFMFPCKRLPSPHPKKNV